VPRILKSVIEVNDFQTERLLNLLKEKIGELNGKTITVLGLAFKSGTDDIRESQSIKLIKSLHEKGAIIKCYDPVAVENAKNELKDYSNIEYFDIYEDALANADAAVIMTDWDIISSIDYSEFIKLMKNPVVIDCCRIYDKKEADNSHINYIGIGYR